MVKRAGSIALLLLCAGCATSHRAFEPSAKEVAETGTGGLAAVYELRTESRWGEVRVWSDGAELREVDGVERTFVHVGFETRNTCEARLELDLAHTRLEAIDAGPHAVDDLAASGGDGDPGTPPHQVGTFDMEFELPEGVRPTAVRGFRVHWWIHGPDGQLYEQFTSFVPLRTRWHPTYYYDPWLFGFQYGFRVGDP